MESEEKISPRVGTARKLARNLLQEAGIISPPIIIRDIVACLRKSRVVNIDPTDLGGTSGVQVSEGETINIAYNKDQHVHRQRFTVAHEIGHVLLGHTHKEGNSDLLEEGGAEYEANQFAAELLMPRTMLKNDIVTGLKDVQKLSIRYVMSSEAMWRRIEQCGFLKLL